MKTQQAGSTQKGYRRIIPSMTALLQFESVARLNSFTLAAKELGVTQAAVSKQIKVLEENIGVQLFQRLHRSIYLTEGGETLFAIISESLQKIASGFDQITQGSDKRELVLGSTATFSHCRIMPRLASLSETLPHIRLRLATQMFTGNLRTPDFDLDVRFGNGEWDDGHALLLFEEEVFPVCSPAWLARNPIPLSLDELAGAGLLDADATSEGWVTWQSWFKDEGVNLAGLKYNLRCSLYTDAVQAALNGYGVALGWGRMVEHFIDAGTLVRLEPFVVRPKDAYYLVVPHGHCVNPDVLAIAQWLQVKTQAVQVQEIAE
ncbi:LysR substrate-binding domain-containing protein [Pseudomonas sp. 21LCFQ010]|uniref:LysR substrate-binding domain-containing protein n=1 Tax=unclassified Pseudomonas TaxID=196821 RepID=UPI0004F5C08F|nr:MULTISPECIES: LysR substrate-binding domain-containing protein [unclassified Pseudomonas]MCO8164373.1 LysR substrate-binding domain-containing protein [Pseudomonas sp. 21LCFQ010]BAP45698.1 LysR family transcriptional regulator [Pseudomonas sp. StFLB209]